MTLGEAAQVFEEHAAVNGDRWKCRCATCREVRGIARLLVDIDNGCDDELEIRRRVTAKCPRDQDRRAPAEYCDACKSRYEAATAAGNRRKR